MNDGDFLRLVDEYQSSFRHERLEKFEHALPYDLFPDVSDSIFDQVTRWPNPWPLPSRAGVYAFLDQQMTILHVGKAPFRNSLAAHLSSYCRYEPGRRSSCKLHQAWKNSPKYIVIVAVPQSSRFEAAALEEFLISKIQPIENSVGIEGITKQSSLTTFPLHFFRFNATRPKNNPPQNRSCMCYAPV